MPTLDIVQELTRAVLCVIDIAFIHQALSRLLNCTPDIRIAAIGLGWSFADTISYRIPFLWMHAFKAEWDWSNIFIGLGASFYLLLATSITHLVWLRGASASKLSSSQKRFATIALVCALTVPPFLEAILRANFPALTWAPHAVTAVVAACSYLVSSGLSRSSTITTTTH